jgi:hypothetical protein
VAIDILGSAHHHQPPANILLAAVQYLLLGGLDHPLAAHYPSLRLDAGPDGDPVTLFHDLLVEHRDRIVELVSTRTVQTNEVRRCATLLPAFTAACEPGRSITLVEVGASAGLNLLFDRYRYAYGSVVVGPGDSPLTLTSEIRTGQPPIPDEMPAVASRVGIDLHPIDVTDPDAVRWAQALIWPEQVERVERFETAVSIARSDPPEIRAGDALDLLPAVIESAPADASLLVYHSFVLNQWDVASRSALDAMLAGASVRRRIDRVSIEMLVPGQAAPVVEHTRYESGDSDTKRLGTAHHHGEWLRWEG